MPIRKTPIITKYYYHIYNRGVNKQPIFTNKYDYKRLVSVIKYYNFVGNIMKFSRFMHLSNAQRQQLNLNLENSTMYVDIISYCLMPNHFHLLLKQNVDGGISKFLSNLQNSYTKYYNTKYNRTGHLFQGQFKSVLVSSDEQLTHVSRYIHLNPYSSAIVKDIKDLDTYEWSSYPEYIKNNENQICQKDILVNLFGGNLNYIKFVRDNADYQKKLEDIKHLFFE